MGYARQYGNRRYTTPKGARWMDLRYAGTCHICGTALEAGARGFYDPADRTVTCTSIACADIAGLTRSEWFGAPTSGKWVDVLSVTRLGKCHCGSEQHKADPYA